MVQYTCHQRPSNTLCNRFHLTTILLLHVSIMSSCIINCLFSLICKYKSVCRVKSSLSRETVKISNEWLSRKRHDKRQGWSKQRQRKPTSKEMNEPSTLIWIYLKLCDGSIAVFSRRSRVFTPIEAFHFVIQLSNKVYFQWSRPWKTRRPWFKKKGT